MLAVYKFPLFYVYQPLKLAVVLCNISVWIEGSKGKCWRRSFDLVLRWCLLQKQSSLIPADHKLLNISGIIVPAYPNIAFRYAPDRGGMPLCNLSTGCKA
ncbi:MAG: hypothetical protein CO093_08535 [Alphaproteobacteria bacterium CG_4_9_14_3_um_filter_47_13]|nr:MAG: hypothetical protein CO093_08535 [Alphaproteobacteria bacterium CG_4_9_14_3_um_filter_47_13]